MKIESVKIYVIDTETTGLDGYDKDLIVEIAICEVDPLKKEYRKIYDSVVGHNTKNWPYYLKDSWIFGNSNLTLEDVAKAKKQELVAKEIRTILDGKIVTSFNSAFDMDKFLLNPPWNLHEVIYRVYPCIMIESTSICKIPGYQGYKWPSLYEAHVMLCKENKRKTINHRALDDAIMASEVLIEILKIEEKSQN